jgi:NAD(P)H dehydrogenase (quinone)
VSVLSPVQVVLAHPHSGSLDHRLTARVDAVLRQAGVRHNVHDLYAESFDPVLTDREAIAGEPWTRGTSSEQVTAAAAARDPLVDRHRRELADAAALVVVHPDWWGKPPAMLAGWLDRVLLAGQGADRDVDTTPAPRLRRVLVINTSDQPVDTTRKEHDPLGILWRDQIGPFLGSPDFERLCFRPVGSADQDQLARWNNACDRAAAWACGASR